MKLVVATAVMLLSASLWSQTNITLHIQEIPTHVISFQGNLGTGYVIQASTNLLDWFDVQRIGASTNSLHSYTNSADGNSLFYRTLAIPSTNAGSVVLTCDPTLPAPNQVVQLPQGSSVSIPALTIGVQSPVDSTLTTISVVVHVAGVTSLSALVRSVSLFAQGVTYTTDLISPSGIAVFTNLNVALRAGTTRSMTVYAQCQPNQNSILNDSSLWISVDTGGVYMGQNNNPVIVDQAYTTLAVNQGMIQGNTQVFTDGILVANSASVWMSSISNVGGTNVQSCTMTVSVTAGMVPIYMCKTNATSFPVVVTGNVNYTPTLFYSSNSGGDSSTYFMLYPGTTATLTLEGIISGPVGSWGTVSAGALYYSVSPTNWKEHVITNGLGALQRAIMF